MLSDKTHEINQLYNEYNKNGATLELEAKFGFYHRRGFNSNVPYIHFERLLNHLRSKNYPEIIEESSVASLDGIRRITTINPGNEPETVVWQTKTILRDFNFNEYDIRISLNLEENLPVDKIPNPFVPKTIRDRTRYSFILEEDQVKIDLTQVMMRSEDGVVRPRYEVEIEFNGNPNQLALFDKAVLDILKILRGTNIIYTNATKTLLIRDAVKILGSQRPEMIDKNVLVEARNIKKRDLVYGGIVGNPDTAYRITFKADGLRKMLIIHTTGIWLVYPPFEFNLVIDPNSKIPNMNRLLQQFTGTILDGELVKPKSGFVAEYWYLGFDCLAVRGTIAIQTQEYSQREALVKGVTQLLKNNVLTAELKPSDVIETPEKFFELVTSYLNQRQNLPYNDDGLIFFPAHSVYNPHSEQHELYRRSLTRYPDTCKWKESRDITIDFSLKWIDDGKLELYSYDDDSKDMVPFKGTLINPFSNEMIDYTNPLTKGRPTGLVVEYEYRPDTEQVVPRRIRHDKHGPNRLSIAQDNWDDIMKPITRDDIEGKTIMMTAAYHNRIKRQLYSLIPKGSNILNIGSGFGGDIDKEKNVGNLIVAVEPNLRNSTEFRSRLKIFDMEDKVTIVETGGEDTVAITNAVRSFIPGGKVDVVSLMLSMSFFWSSTEHLDALVKTIVTNLKPGGMIIFLTVNGDTVEQIFEPALGGKHITNKKIVTADLHLYPKPTDITKGRALDFNLPNTIVGDQREYLVRIQDLSLRLSRYGIHLQELHRAEGERLLSKENLLFTSMYSFGHYISEEDELLPNDDITITNIKLPDIEMQNPLKLPELPLPSVPVLKLNLVPQSTVLHMLPVSTQPMIGNRDLPALNDDTYVPVKCTWYDNVVRIATIGDGSCFFHAVLKGYDRLYQENVGSNYRMSRAAAMRRDVAVMLGTSNPIYPGRTYWETTSNGAFPRILMQEIIDETLVEEIQRDYSIAGLQRLFNSSSYLGDEVYSFVADALDIDVYVLRGTTTDLHPHLTTKTPGILRNAVVIMGNTYHYEVIGIDNGELFQTVFPPDDPFLIAIRSLIDPDNETNWNVRTDYDPDETFVHNVVDTFAIQDPSNPNRFVLEIPKAVEEIFRPNDIFRVTLDRLRPQIEAAINDRNAFMAEALGDA